MTPKLFYALAKKVEVSKKRLKNIALYAFLTFIILAALNAVFADVLYGITLTPIGILLFIFGLGFLPLWYKDKKNQNNFIMFWSETNIVGKLFLWYGSIFMCVWFLLGIIFTIFSVVQTMLYVVGN